MSTVEEARIAVRDGADYVGIGAVWPTGSKDVTAKVKLAPDGVGAILDVLAGTGVESVAIGETRISPGLTQAVFTCPTCHNCCTDLSALHQETTSLASR